LTSERVIGLDWSTKDNHLTVLELHE